MSVDQTDNIETLNDLLNLEPWLYQHIQAEKLCSRYRSERRLENTSPLYCLTRRSAGHVLLKDMLEKNPELAKGIPAEALCLVIPSGEDANTSAFYWLRTNPEGQQVLCWLLSKNASLLPALRAIHQRQGHDPNNLTHNALALFLSDLASDSRISAQGFFSASRAEGPDGMQLAAIAESPHL